MIKPLTPTSPLIPKQSQTSTTTPFEASRLSDDSFRLYKREFYNALSTSIRELSDNQRTLLIGDW